MTKLEELAPDPQNFQSFIVFDPASIRVPESDIYIIGPKVSELVDEVFEKIHAREQDIKMKILINKMGKLRNMLDLVTNHDNIIMSKFFHRVWRRYSYISHLGESFYDLSAFAEFFPDHMKNVDTLVANRLDISADDEDFEDDDEEKKEGDDAENSDDLNVEKDTDKE